MRLKPWSLTFAAWQSDGDVFLILLLEDFFNLDALHRTSISEQVVQSSWHNTAGASPKGTLDCISTWVEDFRQDLQRFDVPTLVIHGIADRILPISATTHRLTQFVKGSRVLDIAFGPHAITWTHPKSLTANSSPSSATLTENPKSPRTMASA